MIQQIVSTTWKDIQILFKDFGGIALLFLMPLMFIIVMSTALYGLFDDSSDANPRLLPVLNLDRGEHGAEVVAALDSFDGIEVETTWEGETLTRDLAEALVADGVRSVVVVFPSDFSDKIKARVDDDKATATIKLITDPTVSVQFIAPIQGMVFGAAERVAETQVAQAQIASFLTSAFAQLPAEMRPSTNQITVEVDGGSVIELESVAPAEMNITVYPDTYQQNVPGYTVFGVFFIVGTMAGSMLEEKRDGTFRRLLVAPLAKPVLLIGKIMPYYLVNLIQIAIMFGVAHLLFGMSFGDPSALVAISMAMSAAATGLGIMIASLGKTEAQVSGLSTLLTLTLSALGGCMMPTYIMPGFLQTISQFTPHFWAMQGFQDVLVRGYGLAGILAEAGVLLGFAAVFFLVGVWRFRFD